MYIGEVTYILLESNVPFLGVQPNPTHPFEGARDDNMAVICGNNR